jgi:protein BCP1
MTGKRKAESSTSGNKSESDSDDSGYAPSAIDVSFNYVTPVEIDFAALKRLTQQLFHTHSADLNLSALVDDILSWGNKSVGTVVKVEDDEDGDPFAFASVIDLAQVSKSEASKVLRQYYTKVLNTNTASTSKAAQSIQALLASTSAKSLQIFHERMINLPPQIMPPLYRMLFDEIAASTELNVSSCLLGKVMKLT